MVVPSKQKGTHHEAGTRPRHASYVNLPHCALIHQRTPLLAAWVGLAFGKASKVCGAVPISTSASQDLASSWSSSWLARTPTPSLPPPPPLPPALLAGSR